MSIIEQFEKAIAEYTGAPYTVALDSCTSGIYSSLRFFKPDKIVLPKQTFISVYTYSLFSKTKVEFDDIFWDGMYKIDPTTIYDCAKTLTQNMYIPGSVMCLSFGREKPLSITDHHGNLRGGMILTDNKDLVDFTREIFDTSRPRAMNCERCFFNYDVNFSMKESEAKLGYKLFTEKLESDDPVFAAKDSVTSSGYPDLSQYKLLKVKNKIKILSHPDDPENKWILENARYINKYRYLD
ncbi:MAG: hypothetical protein CMA30_02260 [Euryarchaeota archaeon]|nr:hypothetical protein [Euryarchaeota archaeon]